jgi:hypothetical protein
MTLTLQTTEARRPPRGPISAPSLFARAPYRKLTPVKFFPTNAAEMKALGWQACDVVLVTGDAYIDHPSFGMALVARLLESQGFRVGILAQPDWSSAEPFRALGKPALYFGITGGNYTLVGGVREKTPRPCVVLQKAQSGQQRLQHVGLRGIKGLHHIGLKGISSSRCHLHIRRAAGANDFGLVFGSGDKATEGGGGQRVKPHVALRCGIAKNANGAAWDLQQKTGPAVGWQRQHAAFGRSFRCIDTAVTRGAHSNTALDWTILFFPPN